METVVTTSVSEAASFVRRGHLSSFPTETVYGLGADALNPDAIRKIFKAKGRPADNPLIVHVAEIGQVEACATRIPDTARALGERFWPGPLTLILPKGESIPEVVTAGLSTIGLRFPSHPIAQAFLDACDTPVAAPSANRSGRPSPTTWRAVQHDLEGRIACILKGDRTDAGIESTVVDCTEATPTVLRPGAISVEALREVVGDVAVSPSEEAEEGAARSPGTRHRHYAPAARVYLVSHPSAVEGAEGAGYIGLDPPEFPDAFETIYVASDRETYAHEVFHFFRACDAAGCDRIYAQTVEPDGIGRALNDRLRRAAAR